jgi:hypothetical protein
VVAAEQFRIISAIAASCKQLILKLIAENSLSVARGKQNACISSSVVVNYNTSGQGLWLAPECARNNADPQAKSSKLKENET